MTRPGRLAGKILTVATRMLEPGPARTRYEAELYAEQWDLSWGRQIAHAVVVLLRMPQLRAALREAGALRYPHSSLWCRLRLHHLWTATRTEDGRPYKRCRACGIDNDETYLTAASDVTGAALRGPPM